ncbi:MAG: glycosyltransferase [Candidatus Omnitrophica bacterium]|nr:glycosyltransferase [Candidatus Omnitrophota bacterium]
MPPARILLMYISEVSGHHSATLAIEKALRILSPGAEILNINAFNYTNPISEKIVNRLYMSIIKMTPRIWDYLYDNDKIVKKINSLKETVHKLNSPKLKNLFDDFKPDVVACSQAFPCGMAADFKKTYRSSIPLVAVLTDHVPHSYWIYDTIDYYVAPSEDVALRLTKKGVPAEKIKPLGIPFDPKFNKPVVRAEVSKRLGFDPGKLTVLIMGGGHGLGPIKSIVKSLETVNADFQEIIVTGVNRKLYKSLKKNLPGYKKKIALFEYASNINELMTACDIIVTKPGGITTAEAMANRLPMIIVRPIPGQEANNTAYLTAKGAAIKIDNAKDINIVVENLISDPARLNDLREGAGRIAKPQASLDIARLLLNLTGRHA